MAFDWTAEDDGGGEQKPIIPAGQNVPLTIVKLVHAKKTGEAIGSGTAPAMIVVFADFQGREASSQVELTDEGAWRLRNILRAIPGFDAAKLNAQGVTPAKFMDADWAAKVLVNRNLHGDVTHQTGKGSNAGKTYANVKPVIVTGTRPPEPAMQQPPAFGGRQPAAAPNGKPAMSGVQGGSFKPQPDPTAGGGFDPSDIPFD